jgi:pimeloyl-ACP methyl ester carboxylesterase
LEIQLCSLYLQETFMPTNSHPLSPPGKRVDIGGYSLHYVLQGTEHDGATVVLESTLTMEHFEWFIVQREVAQFAPVLSYDRAGLGWSNPSPYPISSEQAAQELATLLTSISITRPVILVGASIGGLIVRQVAALYPELVAGMVLVDSTHEDQFNRFPPGFLRANKAQTAPRMAMLRQFETFSHEEIVATVEPFDPDVFSDDSPYPAELRAMIIDRMTPEGATAALREFEWVNQLTGAGKQTPHSLGHLPLIVLHAVKQNMPAHHNADDWSRYRQISYELQSELAALSTHSRYIQVDCGHVISNENPAAVVDAIRQMVEQVRA